MSDLRPRRSVLYMPGANERALEKAQTIPADALILDLEDAVAPDAKPEARERVCAAATSGAYGNREIAIRANGIGTAWHDDDLAAIAAAGPAAVVIPKINSAAEVHQIEHALEAAGAPDHTRIWAMLETPIAMLSALEIAVELRAPRRARDGHERPRQGAPGGARFPAASRCSRASGSACWRRGPPAR